MTEPEPVFVNATVTCHTPDCGNAEIPLDIQVVDTDSPVVICGPCGQPITDVIRETA